MDEIKTQNDTLAHIGVTTDVKRSMTEHGVDGSVPHIRAKANSPALARNVVRSLLYRGMIGDLENYDKEAAWVYVYEKSGINNPYTYLKKTKELPGLALRRAGLVDLKCLSVLLLIREEFEESTVSTKKLLDEHRWNRLLVDLRGVMNRVPIADVFYIIEFDRKVFPLVRVGVVFPPGREEDGRFADTVAKNRSVKLKSFVDYEQAVAWLTAKQT